MTHVFVLSIFLHVWMNAQVISGFIFYFFLVGIQHLCRRAKDLRFPDLSALSQRKTSQEICNRRHP